MNSQVPFATLETVSLKNSTFALHFKIKSLYSEAIFLLLLFFFFLQEKEKVISNKRSEEDIIYLRITESPSRR